MKRHWQISIIKGGRLVRLFAETTTDMVEADLYGNPDVSLIRTARQFHRHAQIEEQDHRDLAIGAIMAYAAQPPYDLAYTQIEKSLIALHQASPVHVEG